MRRWRGFRVGCAAALVLGFGAGAQAHVLPMVPQTGFFDLGKTRGYVSLGGLGAAVQVPRFNAFDTVTGFNGTKTGDLFSHRSTVVGGGPAVTFGLFLPWHLIGHRPRVEFSGSLFFGSDRTRAPASSDFFRIFAIDGSFATVPQVKGNKMPFGGGWLATQVDQGTGILRFKTDFRVRPNLTITPQIGILGGASRTRYRFDYTINTVFFPGRPSLPGYIHETVRAQHFGGQIGADASWRMSRSVTLLGGLTLSVMNVRAHLQGSDCQSNSPKPVGTPCTGTAFRTTVTDGASRVGVDLGGSLGASWSWGWGQLTAMGFVDWSSAVPGVQNPTGAVAAPYTPAHIRFDSEYSYGGFLMASIPFD